MMNNYAETNICKERAITLLKTCLSWFADNDCECVETLTNFKLLGLKNDEIKELGYEYLFDVKSDK